MTNEIQKSQTHSFEIAKIESLDDWRRLISDKSIENAVSLAKINAETAQSSTLPNILKISRQNGSNAILADFYNLLKPYLDVYYPGGNSSEVAKESALLITGEFILWNPMDLVAFVNFIKKNKPDSIGHKISPTELLNSAREYESRCCEVREQIHHNEKFQQNEGIKPPPELKTLLDKLNKKEREKIEESEKIMKIKRDKSIARHKKHQELYEKWQRKEIMPEQAMVEYNNFIKEQK